MLQDGSNQPGEDLLLAALMAKTSLNPAASERPGVGGFWGNITWAFSISAYRLRKVEFFKN